MSKYFFRGNRENGIYLLKKLIKLGGVYIDINTDGTNPTLIYYINQSTNYIKSADLSHLNRYLAMDYVDVSDIEESFNYNHNKKSKPTLNGSDTNWEQREFDLAKELLFSLIKNGFKETLNLDTGEKSISQESIEETIELSIKISNKFINKFKNRAV